MSDVARCIQPEQAELVLMLHLVVYKCKHLCVVRAQGFIHMNRGWRNWAQSPVCIQGDLSISQGMACTRKINARISSSLREARKEAGREKLVCRYIDNQVQNPSEKRHKYAIIGSTKMGWWKSRCRRHIKKRTSFIAS